MLIREIILENFMSYEYARIPLKSGVNLICGPNGAGKSSILLGISVALGQSYTERSKKLSDLIRRGKDVGRVTIVLDNSARNGRRPVFRIKKDLIYLTRVLRRDGKYWFEIDNVHATKSDVVRLLSHFGVDPDNMLIIMHQDMAEQFIVTSPQEKLKLVEAAAGLEPYRRNVLEAQKKLSRIVSQEESLSKMLESAEQTLNYWREQYDRFQEKKQLILKRNFLERELAWAEVSKREQAVSELKKRLEDRRSFLEKIEGEIKLLEAEVTKLQEESKDIKNSLQTLFEKRLALEREKAQHELNVLDAEKNLKNLQSLLERSQKGVKNILSTMLMVEDELKKLGTDQLETRISELKSAFLEIGRWPESLELYVENIEGDVKISAQRITVLDSELAEIKNKSLEIDQKLETLTEQMLEKRINLALLEYQKKEIQKELDETERGFMLLQADLDAAIKKAKEMGARIVALRSVEEVLDEIRLVDGRVAALGDVSAEIERMYESYSNLYLELKEKARVAAENREKVLEEIRTRMDAWRTVIRNLLDHVNLEYQRILNFAVANGAVRLVNDHDIEETGIEILVGFKGSAPQPLNIYSQSGGERSTAVMAFLLALQQRIRSPFRAVDEYDVHMDPKNREVIANLLISAVEGGKGQYLAITPNQMYFENKDIHVIMVQNIEGTSVVKEVS
ncbi:AAA family ATPase [Candidatus Bathyarchaeota archaeon]|nr:AAA family ATPase [Candidatus Bathyarchaeota archaeon]